MPKSTPHINWSTGKPCRCTFTRHLEPDAAAEPDLQPILGHVKRAVEPMPWGESWEDHQAAKPSYKEPGHQLGFSPEKHREGKGLLFEDGDVWTWPTHEMKPQHMEYNKRAQKLGKRAIPGTAFHLARHPAGEGQGLVWQFGDGRSLSPEQQAAISAADPRLSYGPPPGAIPSTAPTPPADFGHARNVLDILDAHDRESGKESAADRLWLGGWDFEE